MLKSISLLIVLVLSASCDESSKKKDPYTDIYFVHGDVSLLYQGYATDRGSFINLSEVDSFNNYSIASLSAMFERTEKAEVDEVESQEDLENQNSTSREGSEAKLNNFTFIAEDEGVYIYKDLNNSFPLSFVFRATDGKLNLIALKDSSGEQQSLDMVHYSLAEDKRLMSFMFEFNDPKRGKGLIAAYFSKNTQETPWSVEKKKDYAYIQGDGVAVGWQKDLNLDICGPEALMNQDLVVSSMKEWEVLGEEGKVGGLSYNISVNNNPPPFSDVNTNCIYYSRGYRFEDQDGTVVLGLAFPRISMTDPEILSASLIMLPDSFIKAREEFGSDLDPADTLTHELGHVLGLGHEFKRNLLGNTKYPSIMGYEDVSEVTERDVEAILALYPIEVLPKEDPKVVLGETSLNFNIDAFKLDSEDLYVAATNVNDEAVCSFSVKLDSDSRIIFSDVYVEYGSDDKCIAPGQKVYITGVSSNYGDELNNTFYATFSGVLSNRVIPPPSEANFRIEGKNNVSGYAVEITNLSNTARVSSSFELGIIDSNGLLVETQSVYMSLNPGETDTRLFRGKNYPDSYKVIALDEFR
ncbi:hypothetical protein [Pseudobacteriovorax antillogorgiicola]|uniref:Matrixin n=1 Tax=Pseudobacteriovorax antillogorgiicola TaxID=1513793 RepID=A0A1Y6BGQ8_9BACT|nr:hypothetical protein [Pseudobacteriovorax antillogorgiicola]TCS57306.1 hypothetical protein EDD56_10346 [Pseudobacteriovorax antillogorgiicola]SMF02747.1 hypothetical protein SAMN06296036_103287 [Pseudobacteriovorax antillogorgiicola]